MPIVAIELRIYEECIVIRIDDSVGLYTKESNESHSSDVLRHSEFKLQRLELGLNELCDVIARKYRTCVIVSGAVVFVVAIR